MKQVDPEDMVIGTVYMMYRHDVPRVYKEMRLFRNVNYREEYSRVFMDNLEDWTYKIHYARCEVVQFTSIVRDLSLHVKYTVEFFELESDDIAEFL